MTEPHCLNAFTAAVDLRRQVESLRAALSLIQEMAAEDLRTDRVAAQSSTWQIEADARAALQEQTR